MGLTIPYVHRGVTHSYVPDFLVRLRQREGDVVRTLIVEVSGGQKSPGPTRVKAATARDSWCAAVNNHSGFGRWGYVEITSMPTARERLGEAIQALYADQPIVGDPRPARRRPLRRPPCHPTSAPLAPPDPPPCRRPSTPTSA